MASRILVACLAVVVGCGAGGAEEGENAAIDGAVDSEPDALVDVGSVDTDVPAEVAPDSAVSDAADAMRPLDDLEALFAAKFTPIVKSTSFGDPASAGYHCLAAASAVRRARAGAAFDPTFRDALIAAVHASADMLVSSAPKWGGAGWGLGAAWDAFGDGTTNSATTVYAFQTGLAIWCLVEAADVTGDASYRALAKKALDAYRAAYIAYGKGYTIDCTTCGYYWYSLDKNDLGRFVKNTNIEMATAALALDYYGADAPAKAEALAAASSQYGEIVSYANYGYLGRFDKGFTVAGKTSMDDHNSFEAYLLLRTAQLLSRKDFGDASVTHYRAYAPKGTPAYVAYAACHFARTLPEAKPVCVSWITANGATNPAGVGLVMDYRH